MVFHVKLLSKYVLAWGTKSYFLKFLGEILLPSTPANAVLCGSKANALLAFPSQHKIFTLQENATSLPKFQMIDQLRRLEALVSDSGLFKAGREHEREHVKALILVRMDQLHENSIAWQECRNLLDVIK
jgi:hypothetical protein